ncbi:HAD hydrolase family protein [Chromobacterium piscinae]|uniref:HAD family hydrolase n=1 Tax=Chromobacterium piscinae TaxID=686831 RepID=UPI0031FE274C
MLQQLQRSGAQAVARFRRADNAAVEILQRFGLAAAFVRDALDSAAENGGRLRPEGDGQAIIHNHDSAPEYSTTFQQIVDITAAGVDKAAALARHGIAADEMVCFGNDSNDIPMFAVARHSVQVGEHAQLGTLATERIARGDDTEEQLIATMRLLGERFAAA